MTPSDVNFEEKTWQLVLKRLDDIDNTVIATNNKMDRFMSDNSTKAHECRKEIFAAIEKKADKEEFTKIRDIVYKGLGGMAVLMAIIGIILKFA